MELNEHQRRRHDKRKRIERVIVRVGLQHIVMRLYSRGWAPELYLSLSTIENLNFVLPYVLLSRRSALSNSI